MDARELLRRYLAQRRELGESEFVLDSLTVEAALAALGVKNATHPSDGAVVTGDWRQTLTAAGAKPSRTSSTPVTQPPVAPQPPPPMREPKPPVPAVTPSAPTVSVVNEGGSLVVGSEATELFTGRHGNVETLEALSQVIAGCTLCALHATAIKPVPGEGNPHARLVCVGEAPGATEDETGRPFVGRAGDLLTKILEAIDLKREDVFICNVLKHRPPGNRNPAPDEIIACRPYLLRQLEIIRPTVILALGTFAAQTLLDTRLAIGKLRENVHRFYGIPLVVTYHPAALLRNPHWKRPTWEDVKLVRRLLDRAPDVG